MLQQHHFDGETWRLLRAILTARLADHRTANDRPQNTDVQTAIIRGRIQELKDLLALETTPADKTSPDQALEPYQHDDE